MAPEPDNGRRVYVDQVTPSRDVGMTVEVGSSFPLPADAKRVRRSEP